MRKLLLSVLVSLLIAESASAGPLYGTVRLAQGMRPGVTVEVACPGFSRRQHRGLGEHRWSGQLLAARTHSRRLRNAVAARRSGGHCIRRGDLRQCTAPGLGRRRRLEWVG